MTMSGFFALIVSTMLLKSRVGVGCLMISSTSMPMPGSSLARRLAVPVPKAESSCTMIAVLAALLAAALISLSAGTAALTNTP
jgi:hypothetical protein